ncbi:MAG: membrane dipeptidase [Desulfobacterales bacterium]|jgi:microsomal dipeptidase-like Zn-dependent dipeptidase|nr:membrane dipeptidase [Desulfobacterales bacterium]
MVTRYAELKQLVEMVELMIKHGYKENDAKRFLGENFLRVARQVWN